MMRMRSKTDYELVEMCRKVLWLAVAVDGLTDLGRLTVDV